MSVDGTDLSKITGDGMKVIAEAAVAAAAPAVVSRLPMLQACTITMVCTSHLINCMVS